VKQSDVGAREADTKYHTSQFLINKAEGLGTWQHADPLCCACPRPHTPFRCTGRLHQMSLQLQKPICGGPSCISPIKRCPQAHAFATFGHFPWACICTPFLRWFRARTYKGLHTKHFPGLNNAWERPCACPSIPRPPTRLIKTRALVTHAFCLFCLHQIFQDLFILLSMKF